MKWPTRKLGQILHLEYGSALKESNREARGSVPVAGSNGVVGYHSEALVKGPGIVVGRKGSAGEVTWFKTDFWPIDTTYYVRLTADCDLRWTYYLLRFQNLPSLSVVTGVPGLNRNDAYRLQVQLPALSEQRRIVQILDQAEALRKKRDEADAKAERILPALFCKMFGAPATNPKGWTIAPLGELGDLDRGRSRHRPRNAPELLGGRYPFIQTGDVANSMGYVRRYSSSYSELGLAQSKMWPAGTLCITIAANIAATAILGFDACFPDSVVGFTPGPKTNSAYVRVLLKYLQPVLESSASQVAQKNINLKVLRELLVPVPPKEIQNRFAIQHDRALLIDESRLKSRKHFETLWKGLLHRAFTGDLTSKWREARMNGLISEMQDLKESLGSDKSGI